MLGEKETEGDLTQSHSYELKHFDTRTTPSISQYKYTSQNVNDSRDAHSQDAGGWVAVSMGSGVK